jgi:hypothetical protein
LFDNIIITDDLREAEDHAARVTSRPPPACSRAAQPSPVQHWKPYTGDAEKKAHEQWKMAKGHKPPKETQRDRKRRERAEAAKAKAKAGSAGNAAGGESAGGAGKAKKRDEL